uniref:Solute carrier family 47 member 3 n=1 Tax=Monopterus albus TaxID=43700 RepID=A0A3Q3Q3Z2_MONAL
SQRPGQWAAGNGNFQPRLIIIKNLVSQLIFIPPNFFSHQIMAQLMVFSVSFVSTVFCGHLGKTELAGVALAIAVINVTGISIGNSLSSACDTLISQTVGSRNLLRVGVILQRAILILLLACFPCWAILINTEPILLAVRQDPEVARLAQMYVKIFMPALPATFMYSLETRYLQNQVSSLFFKYKKPTEVQKQTCSLYE